MQRAGPCGRTVLGHAGPTVVQVREVAACLRGALVAGLFESCRAQRWICGYALARHIHHPEVATGYLVSGHAACSIKWQPGRTIGRKLPSGFGPAQRQGSTVVRKFI
jgi:hypothetical protein